MRTMFSTTLWQDGNNTGIEVPPQYLAELGRGKRVPIVVSVNGYSYRSTTASMGGKVLIPFAKSHREASGIEGGDAIDVELTVDNAPRTVELPHDARTAAIDAGVLSRFEAVSPSRQKELVRSIEDAKKPETRLGRIQKMIQELSDEH